MARICITLTRNIRRFSVCCASYYYLEIAFTTVNFSWAYEVFFGIYYTQRTRDLHEKYAQKSLATIC